jgi:hypothetical protein
MTTHRLFLTLAALVALALIGSIALAGAQRTQHKAVVSRTPDASQAADTFTTGDRTLYCIAEVSTAAPKGTYKFIWGHYEPPHTTPQTIFQEEVDYKGGDHVISKFASSRELPAGDYSVNVWTPSGHLRAAFSVKP